MDIDRLAEKINNHYGEVYCFATRPSNTFDKDGNPVNTQIELHIGKGLTLILDDTSESEWYVKEGYE